jgi:nitric-oxide synthase, bacterial
MNSPAGEPVPTDRPSVAARLSAGWQLPRRLRECDDFYAQPEVVHSPARRAAASRELREYGVYRQTLEEISIGAQLAWRNHDRCVGRKHWRSLEVLDARAVDSAEDLAEACFEHLRSARHGRALRCLLTVGPPAQPDGAHLQIISPQLIQYAGYRRTDGSVLGDPANITLTDLALELGWGSVGTAFDVLPLVIATPTGPPRWFDVPHELVFEVDIEHPDYHWFADLGLKWYAVPAVSNMDLEIGGVTYPAAPFNGWYVSTEIGARNLADRNRYDMLPAIAERMDLDTSSERTLWRDRALVELNVAVLYSYRNAGVHIVDHHTVARQFIDHVERENAAGRRCPTDWSWINPPMSSALTPTFHRYYDPPDAEIRPNFLRKRGGLSEILWAGR